jgi:hypothetical protein
MITGPELQTYMNTLLTQLNTAVHQVTTNNAVPKTKEELLNGLKKEINVQAKEIIGLLVTNHKIKLQEKLVSAGRAMMSVPLQSSSAKLENAVRVYLQKKYLTALEGNTLSNFQDTLQDISEKIDNKLSSGTMSTNQTRLLITIEAIVSEFLG